MNRKIEKVISICLIVMAIISIASTTVFALSPSEIKPSNVETSSITKVGSSVIGILQTVGIVLYVIVLIVIGLKYMMGSAEEKAEYKKTLLPYIIGAALVFAASTIASVVFNFASSI